MKILFPSLLLILASASQAKDFRALNFGESCDDLMTSEQANGSAYTGSPDERSLFAFRGSYQGWPAIVVYLCREGRFVSGSYILGRTSLSEAKAFFSELKRRLVLEYEKPTTDFASPEIRRKLEESLGHEVPETETYSCEWNKENMRIQLSMNGPFGGEGWQTSVTFSAPGGI